MSLINDALKRTETDKLTRSREAGEFDGLSPIYGSRGSGRLKSTVLLGAVLLVAVAGTIWAVSRWEQSLPPQKASATVSAAQPVPAREQAVAKPARKGPEAREAVKRDAEIALAKTLAAVHYYQPPAHPARGPAAEPPAGRTPTPQQPKTKTPPAAHEPPQPRPATHRRPQDTPQTPPLRVKPPGERYKLNGILRGDAGATAIINGFFARQGQTVLGAKVVRIDSRTVQLEVGGERVTLRMQ